MKAIISRKVKSEVSDLMRIGNEAKTDSDNAAYSLKVLNLEYIFEMLAELRQIAKKSDEKSLIYYIGMAALEAGEICDQIKFQQDLEDGKSNKSGS
ncbi:MAG: hypothetical protein L3J32_04455 [Rhizobiaceae bacterium]|nr:hypothetical protein [Rhizobiaceae bacterium]